MVITVPPPPRQPPQLQNATGTWPASGCSPGPLPGLAPTGLFPRPCHNRIETFEVCRKGGGTHAENVGVQCLAWLLCAGPGARPPASRDKSTVKWPVSGRPSLVTLKPNTPSLSPGRGRHPRRGRCAWEYRSVHASHATSQPAGLSRSLQWPRSRLGLRAARNRQPTQGLHAPGDGRLTTYKMLDKVSCMWPHAEERLCVSRAALRKRSQVTGT